MLRYLGNRLLYAIPTVTCVVFAVFLLLHLIPGDPAQVMLGVGASEQDLAALREKLGLDRPLVVQFARYARGVLSGDLGDSFAYRKEVLPVILERLPATLELTFAAMLLACGIGIPLGVEAAIRRRSSFDLLCRVIALTVHADEASRRKALAVGMGGFVVKGAGLKALLDVITKREE